MTELEKLKAQLPDAPEDILPVLLGDAEESVKQMTNRGDVSAYGAGIRAVAVIMYNRQGREGETSHGSGGVSVGYDDLPNSVKHLLPKPLAYVGGRRFENVEAEPEVQQTNNS